METDDFLQCGGRVDSKTGLNALETAVRLVMNERTSWIIKILLLSGAELPSDGVNGRFSGSSEIELEGSVEGLLRVWERFGGVHRE